MIHNGTSDAVCLNQELKEVLEQIKVYFENSIKTLEVEVENKNIEIQSLRNAFEAVSNQCEGKSRLINKLLADITKLQSDIQCYKRSYEKRSIVGRLMDKIVQR